MTKSIRLQIRMTPEEKAEIKRLADSLHISVSDYIRMVSLTPAVHNHQNTAN